MAHFFLLNRRERICGVDVPPAKFAVGAEEAEEEEGDRPHLAAVFYWLEHRFLVGAQQCSLVLT
ncbi:MAG: hypothetical protein KME49_11435 [Brasilonema octagenarum HA4186-MV1]|nr:hypothetical protein [Brasilonema octagenarum HA4186-MV1]